MSLRMDIGLVGQRRRRRSNYWVASLVAAVLRTAAGYSRPLYPLICSGSAPPVELEHGLGLVGQAAPAAIELRGSIPDRRGVAHSGWVLRRPLYPLICSGSAPPIELEDGPRAGGASGPGGDRATG